MLAGKCENKPKAVRKHCLISLTSVTPMLIIVLASTVQHCTAIVECFYAGPTATGYRTSQVNAGVSLNPVGDNFDGLSSGSNF